VTRTAISAAVPRRRFTFEGRVISVTAFARPWVRFDVVLGDETGAFTLRFSGRRGIPGMRPGQCVRVEGTPAEVRSVLVLLNPLYEFMPDRAPCPCE
jgi:hypothetical protein